MDVLVPRRSRTLPPLARHLPPLLVEAVARVHHWTPGPWGAALRPSSKDTPTTPPLFSLPAGESKRGLMLDTKRVEAVIVSW